MSSRTLLSSVALPIAIALLAACDEPTPKADTKAQKPSAAPSVAAAPPAVAPAATESAAPPKKKEVVCSKDANVTLPDPKFEAEVRVQAQKPEGQLTKADLAKVKTLKLTEAKLNELDPCIFPLFTSVKGMYLPPGKIDDLTPLKTLTTIESLRVAATNIKDLTPLAGLAKLDRLDIGRTPVKDLTPLSGLTNLTELQIDETEVTDLTPISKLKKLEMLQMKRTRISDLSPLKEIKTLKTLYIEGSSASGKAVGLGIPGLKVHDD
ncbi:MAG: leucine-rich repeat domain-containing protein [Polyangiaceae bacterium]|nr:leucine-rich repeat domain-containing protein [Polyangiaceae bacterium]